MTILNYQIFLKFLINKYNIYGIITLANTAFPCHILFNKSYLSKVFKNVCKISLIEYLINFRLEKAMDMLINTNISADAISEKVGFKDYANFYRHFKKKVGCSPKVYRQENLSTIDSIQDFNPTSK